MRRSTIASSPKRVTPGASSTSSASSASAIRVRYTALLASQVDWNSFSSSQQTTRAMGACGCRKCHPAWSRHRPVFVDQTEGGITATQIPGVGITEVRRRFYVERGQLSQCPVRPVSVVVGDVLGQDSFQMSTTEDEHPVEALSTYGADEALGEGVGLRSPDRGADDPDAFGPEDLVETRGELGVPVTDQELDGMDPILQHHGQVPRLLDNPGTGRMSGDPGHMHPSGVELDEEQHVEALQQHCVDREEVTGQHR